MTGEIFLDQSDLPTLRKMADLYTRLAAEDSEPAVQMANRIIAKIATRLVEELDR